MNQMERLSNNAIDLINDLHTKRLDYQSEYLPLIDAAIRLAAYEDTGLEPEDVRGLCEMDSRARMADLLRLEEYQELGSIDHLRELAQAEQGGRLVVLDSPRLPLIWGDDNRDTVLCPNCKHDLMGGFSAEGNCEMHMYQCPYCGQPIDEAKALPREEAEASLEAQKGGNEKNDRMDQR